MDQYKHKHWYILGAGAVGCLWACALRKAGCNVSLLVKADQQFASPPHQQTIKYTQLLNNRAQQQYTVEVIDHHQLRREERTVSQLIIATKSHDALSALKPILPQLSPSANVLCLSNGLGMHEPLRMGLECKYVSEKGERQLLQGVTSDGARLSQPFQVVHTGKGHTYIGQYRASNFTVTQNSIAHSNDVIEFKLPSSFLNTSLVDDIEKRIWHKALVNCVINPLTAFYQCSNGELFNYPERIIKINALCDELSNITNQTNNNINITAKQIASATKEIALLTEKNTSSMLTDLKKGRKLELEHLNMYFIQLAKQYSVPCPHNLDLVSALTKASNHRSADNQL